MGTMPAISVWLYDWLRSERLRFASTDDGSAFDVEIPDTGGRVLRILNREENGFLLFSMASEARFPRQGWTALYPLLSQVNGQLDFGAWVLDPDTERLVFRTALPVEGAAYEIDCIKQVMSYVASSMARMEQAFEDATASTAEG